MEKSKNSSNPMNPGLSLLIVVFMVLCLFTFAAISLVSAKNEYDRADNLANKTKEYYDASNEALMKIAAEAANLTEPKDYVFTINSGQNLEVSVLPTESGYMITKWQVTPSGTWEGDTTMNNLFVPSP